MCLSQSYSVRSDFSFNKLVILESHKASTGTVQNQSFAGASLAWIFEACAAASDTVPTPSAVTIFGHESPEAGFDP
jgi:hypothetical protein